jgi:acetolactate synthase small subunit
MKHTVSITIVFNNRHSDAERVLSLFSSTGYRLAKLNLASIGDDDRCKLVVVTDVGGKNLTNFLTRLRQQVRVISVDCTDGDTLPGRPSGQRVL